jgi:hypothetical protein
MELANGHGIDPDRVSFIKVLKHVRRSVVRQSADTPTKIRKFLATLAAKVRRKLDNGVRRLREAARDSTVVLLNWLIPVSLGCCGEAFGNDVSSWPCLSHLPTPSTCRKEGMVQTRPGRVVACTGCGPVSAGARTTDSTGIGHADIAGEVPQGVRERRELHDHLWISPALRAP